MGSRTYGTSAGLLSFEASKEGVLSGQIGRLGGRLQSDFGQAQIVQKWRDEWSVGQADLAYDAQPPETVAVLKQDVRTMPLARIDGKPLVLAVRDEVLALRDEWFPAPSIKLPT